MTAGTRRWRLGAALAGLLLFPLALAWGEVQVSERQVSDVEGGTRLRVKNDFFDLELVPLGAQAVSFKTRYSDRPWLWTGSKGVYDSGHLFMDNFLGEISPQGELCFLKHQWEVPSRDPQATQIRFWATTKQKLRLEKTFIFAEDSPVVRVKLSLTNQNTEVVTRGLWPNTFAWMSGLKENNFYYRPYERGVMVTGWDAQQQRNVGDEYLRQPVAGWTAALQKDQREGLVWTMDYNWLRWLYNCHSFWTTEWFYDEIPLPPGEIWQTEYQMTLVKGFDSIAHASGQVVAGMVMEEKQAFDLVKPDNPDRPKFVQITHQLSRGWARQLKDVKLKARVTEVDNNLSHDLPEINVGTLRWEPTTVTQRADVAPDLRLACAVTLTGTGPDGQPAEEKYEYYWPGAGGEKFNLVAGGILATYYRKPPPKVRDYPRPPNLAYTLNRPARVLEYRGPGYYRYKVMEAAARGGLRELKGSYFSLTWAGGSLSMVPTSYPEAFSYDLFVLNGVNAQSLTDFGLESMREAVSSGAGMLVLGGYYAYDAGEYAGTKLEEMLPVTLAGATPFLEKLGSAGKVEVAPGAQLLRGIKWPKDARCLWRHRMAAKPETTVELTAGGKPLLVWAPYGKGKVAALLGTPLGEAGRGEVAYWDSPAWVESLSRLMAAMVFPVPESKIAGGGA